MTSFTLHRRDLIQVLSGNGKLILMISALALGAATDLNASSEEDVKTVAALDTKYQAAVKSNDAATNVRKRNLEHRKSFCDCPSQNRFP